MYRNVICITIVILSLLSDVTSGKDNQSQNNALSKSPYALQVQWSRSLYYWYLYPSNGLSIHVKKHLSHSSAIRVGCTINPSTSNSITNRTPDDNDDYPLKNNDYYNGYELHFNYIHYLSKRNRFNLYLSTGPNFHNSEDKSNWTIHWDGFYSSGTDIVTEKERLKSIGFNASIGLEIFIVKEISIIAEYGYAASYNWLDRDSFINSYTSAYEGNTHDEYWLYLNSKYFEIGPTIKKLGFSIYF
ncbi:hypothetical protein HQ585_12515 [candidate division KSB1 bacterium]|nr:hypothetical protein [candidate division KSB1 bacterium]